MSGLSRTLPIIWKEWSHLTDRDCNLHSSVVKIHWITMILPNSLQNNPPCLLLLLLKHGYPLIPIRCVLILLSLDRVMQNNLEMDITARPSHAPVLGELDETSVDSSSVTPEIRKEGCPAGCRCCCCASWLSVVVIGDGDILICG